MAMYGIAVDPLIERRKPKNHAAMARRCQTSGRRVRELPPRARQHYQTRKTSVIMRNP